MRDRHHGEGTQRGPLSPLLSPQEAVELGCGFLSDMTVNLALVAQGARVDPFIAFAPAGGEAAFDAIVAPGTRFVLAPPDESAQSQSVCFSVGRVAPSMEKPGRRERLLPGSRPRLHRFRPGAHTAITLPRNRTPRLCASSCINRASRSYKPTVVVQQASRLPG